MDRDDGFELKRIGPWSYFHLPSLEASGIIHGFMTRSSDAILSDRGEEEAFSRAMGAVAMVSLRQEHGDSIEKAKVGGRIRAGDGLIVQESGVLGIIKTADCVPVILYGPDHGIAAILHAGWRGSAARITQKGVRAMKAMGVRPDRLGVLIGPGIGPCCYGVGKDVVSSFESAGFAEDIFEQRGASTFLDLKKANRRLAEAEGVHEVHDIGLCTACRPDLFLSARRDRLKGRQINFVLLKRAEVGVYSS